MKDQKFFVLYHGDWDTGLRKVTSYSRSKQFKTAEKNMKEVLGWDHSGMDVAIVKARKVADAKMVIRNALSRRRTRGWNKRDPDFKMPVYKGKDHLWGEIKRMGRIK